MRDEITRALGSFMVLELETLLDAVSQYVENSVASNDELSERDRAKLNAARGIQGALERKLAAIGIGWRHIPAV